MSEWNTTSPLDTDFMSLGDDAIRGMKAAIQDSLRGGTTEGLEAVFPGTAPTTGPVFRYRGLKGVTGVRPATGQYGLFFDETRNALQRDSGSAWEDIGTVIPAGTVMVFYQAAAPVGWTKSTANNDKALRVVSGDGGGTGGTDALSTPPSTAHTHTTPGHTLSVDEIPSHTHPFNTYGGNNFTRKPGPTDEGDSNVEYTDSATRETGGGQSHAHGDTGSGSPTAFAPQYIDVIVCAKD